MTIELSNAQIKRLAGFIKNGSATCLEILELACSPFPPPGIDFIDPSFLHEKVYFRRPYLTDWVVIGNKLLGSRLYIKPQESARNIFFPHNHVEPNAQLLMDLIHEIFHTIDQKMALTSWFKKSEAKQYQEGFLDAVQTHFFLTSSVDKEEYLARDNEIKARIATRLISNFGRWNKLPETREELYCALADSGVALPPYLRERIDQAVTANPDLKRYVTRSPFELARESMSHEAAGLNQAAFYYEELGLQEFYWETMIPHLGARVLECLGDRNPYQKMGVEKEYPKAVTERYLGNQRPAHRSSVQPEGKRL